MARRARREEKKRQRWGQIAIGLLLVVLMVVSVAQVAVNQDPGGSYKFNDQKFSLQNDFFTAKIDGEVKAFRYAPVQGDMSNILFQNAFGDFVNITATPTINLFLQQSTYLLTFDPNMPREMLPLMDQIRFELSDEFGTVYNGVTENSTDYPGLQVIDCQVGTSQVPVIKLTFSNATRPFTNITLDGSCIAVLGDPQGLLAARDYLVLGRAGVIPDG